MTTGYNIREGAQILSDRFAYNALTEARGLAGSDWRKPTARRMTVDAGCHAGFVERITDSAEVRTAPLPLRTSEPWSAPQSLPSAEDPLFSNFLLACTIWTVLIFVGAWAYFAAQRIGLL